jgi:hypothetical protein
MKSRLDNNKDNQHNEYIMTFAAATSNMVTFPHDLLTFATQSSTSVKLKSLPRELMLATTV